MPTITLENVTKRYKLNRRQRKESGGRRFETGVENIDPESLRGGGQK